MADTTVRCGACRKPIHPPDRSRRVWIPDLISAVDARYREDVPASRGVWPAAVLTGAAVLWALALERSGAGAAIVRALMQDHAVLVQEPALAWQAYVFLQTFVLKLGVCALLVIYLLWAGQRPARALGLDRRACLDARLALVFFAFSAASGVVSGLDPLTPAFPMHSFFAEALFWGNLTALFSIVVVAPVAEEIFFRGFLYPALARRFGVVAAALGVSALFAAAHIRPDIEGSTLGIIFLGSLGLTAARAMTGSTRASIVLHAIYNLTLLSAGALRYGLLGY